MNFPESSADQPKRKLLDRVRDVCRLKHYSLRTEQAYVAGVNSALAGVAGVNSALLTEAHKGNEELLGTKFSVG